MRWCVVILVVFSGLAWGASAVAQPVCRGVDCGGVGLCFPERAQATCLCDSGYEAAGASCVEVAEPVDVLRERHRSNVGDEVVAIARAQLGLGPHRVGTRFDDDSLGPLHEYLAPHEMWCTDFVAWVYRAAGVPFDGGQGGWQVQNNYAAREWFRQRDLWVDRESESWHTFEPEPGDYVRVHTARFGHSAIVSHVEGDTLFIVEGNFGNRVRIGRHPRFRHDLKIDGFGIVALDNAPPVVDAGAEELVAWGEYSVYLEGVVTDDGPVSQLTMSWSRQEGPGNVTFEDPWSAETWVTFSEPGVYVLQLAGDDGALSSTDEIVVELADEPLEEADLVEAPPAVAGACTATSGAAPGPAFSWALVALIALRSRRH